MKITKIKKNGATGIYSVIFEPTIWEKFWGKKSYTSEFKDSGEKYLFGSGHVYINREGKELGNGNWIGNAIDEFRRSW